MSTTFFKGPGKRGHIVAHDVSLAVQAGKHLLRTQNVSEQNQKHFLSRTQNLCPQQMLRARANGETFVSATMCPQQCVLVCQGLNTVIGVVTSHLRILINLASIFHRF